MMGFGSNMDMLWAMVARETEGWKPEYKKILQSTVVDVIKEKDQVRIAVKPAVQGPEADEVKNYLLNMGYQSVPLMIGAFKCKVRKFE